MKLEGQYIVIYKYPNAPKEITKYEKFMGICENFVTTGTCAFRNDGNEMLLVRYCDIVQMKPLK